AARPAPEDRDRAGSREHDAAHDLRRRPHRQGAEGARRRLEHDGRDVRAPVAALQRARRGVHADHRRDRADLHGRIGRRGLDAWCRSHGDEPRRQGDRPLAADARRHALTPGDPTGPNGTRSYTGPAVRRRLLLVLALVAASLAAAAPGFAAPERSRAKPSVDAMVLGKEDFAPGALVVYQGKKIAPVFAPIVREYTSVT